MMKSLLFSLKNFVFSYFLHFYLYVVIGFRTLCVVCTIELFNLNCAMPTRWTTLYRGYRPTDSWMNSDGLCTGRLGPTDLTELWPTLRRPTDSWLNSDRLCTDRLIPVWILSDFEQADWFLAELWPTLHRPTDSCLNSVRLWTGRPIPGWTLTDFAQADWVLAELCPTLHRPTDSCMNSDRPLPKSHTTESWLIKFLLLVSDLPKPNHLTSNHPFKLILTLNHLIKVHINYTSRNTAAQCTGSLSLTHPTCPIRTEAWLYP